MQNDNFTNGDLVSGIVGIIFLVLFFALYVWLLVMVNKVAVKKGQSGTLWILVSLFCISPLISLIILSLMKKQSIEEENNT